jgi:nucleoside-diphosphate-sugar epimerase
MRATKRRPNAASQFDRHKRPGIFRAAHGALSLLEIGNVGCSHASLHALVVARTCPSGQVFSVGSAKTALYGPPMGLYLVTGGAGFIGSSIAEALLSKGERVRILDDFSTGRRSNVEALPGRVEVIEGSIVDAETVHRAMQGVEVVFHEAAIPSVARSVETPQTSMLANVQGTTVVLDVARHAGVRRLIFAASSSAYGDTPTLPKIETMAPSPLSPYAVSKLTCEHLLKVFASLYGIETLSLRYFNVFGPRQDPNSQYAAVIPNFIKAALSSTRPIVFGDGEQTRDFCYIDNTVSANLLAATTSKKLTGEVVNIACGERISLNTLLAHIGAVAGQKLEAIYEPSRAGDVRDSLASIDAARDLIGYEPKIRVREGLAATYAAFKTLYA